MTQALTLNVGAAALERATRIDEWLASRSEDLVVLTETSDGPGTALITQGLEARGYATLRTASGRDRGVLIAARGQSGELVDLTDELDTTMPWRAGAVLIDGAAPIALVGVYAPSRDRSNGKGEAKRAFLQSLVAGIERVNDLVDGRVLLLGDLNAVPRDHEPSHSGFLSCEYDLHDGLDDIGLLNAHRLLGQPQPHSWFGRTGNAYLYDYAQVGSRLHELVRACGYLSDPIEIGLSDHAAVTVRLDSVESPSVAALTKVS